MSMNHRTIKQLGAATAAVALTAGTLLVVNGIMSSSANADTIQDRVTVQQPATVQESPQVPHIVKDPVVNPAEKTQKQVQIKVKFDPNGSDVADLQSGKVGVGVLPALRFSKSVPDEMRGDVARNFTMTNTATGQPVAGSWAWTGKKTLQFRPEKFWKGRTTFAVTAADPTMILEDTPSRQVRLTMPAEGWEFTTARALVAYVDAKKVRMNIYINGELVRTAPVSLGKKGWETRSGIKVLSGSKERIKTYTSESLGLTTETYRLTAPWNIRLTPTGEFIHTAPWAYSRIGRYNGSHGCTNMFEQDAKFLYEKTIPGDVFVFRGTSKKMESWNGPGGLWNVSDRAWKKAENRVLGS